MNLLNDKERELLGPVLMGEVQVLENLEATDKEKSAALGVLMKAEFLISCIIQETLHEKDELSAKQGNVETGDTVPEAVEPSSPEADNYQPRHPEGNHDEPAPEGREPLAYDDTKATTEVSRKKWIK